MSLTFVLRQGFPNPVDPAEGRVKAVLVQVVHDVVVDPRIEVAVELVHRGPVGLFVRQARHGTHEEFNDDERRSSPLDVPQGAVPEGDGNGVGFLVRIEKGHRDVQLRRVIPCGKP